MTTPVSTDIYMFQWGDRFNYYSSTAYRRVQRNVLPVSVEQSAARLWRGVGRVVPNSVQLNLLQADLRT
ncbi:hypothetical protein LCGC14_0909410 [marine sediment metagenome]|uniref:Uncharacterized protein n=1 Tax=marine sediment metagenome TaxID=412755 RepID=A0A0F9NYT0_9ZZZZ